MKEYAFPDTSHQAEWDSFELHATERASCPCSQKKPSQSAIDFALRWTINRLRPAITSLPDDFLCRSQFDRVVHDLQRQSSPGLPLCYQFPTNGDFIGSVDQPKQANIEMLWNMVKEQICARKSDPLRVFIKQEPHTMTKICNRRFRLIIGVSLVDQVIDHMLFGPLNKREIELFDRIPSAPGWSPVHGGWRMIPSDGIGYDRSSWDWTVPAWLIGLDFELRRQLYSNVTDEWVSLARHRYEAMYGSSLFQLSSGHQFRQSHPGIVKSGSVNTASSNSHMQLLLHAAAAYETKLDVSGFFLAMGDDTIQDTTSPEYVEYLNSIVKVKPETRGEFCSFKFFPGGRFEPQRLGKHLMNLLFVPGKYLKDSLRSLQIIYARSLRLPRIRAIVMAVDPMAYLTDWELEHVLE